MDWDKLQGKTYEALRGWLALEDKAFRKGGDDLAAIAGRCVAFWKDELAGNLTGRFLDAARPTAEALCITYDVGTGKGSSKPRLVAERLKAFAIVGSVLLSSLEEDA